VIVGVDGRLVSAAAWAIRSEGRDRAGAGYVRVYLKCREGRRARQRDTLRLLIVTVQRDVETRKLIPGRERRFAKFLLFSREFVF